MSQLTSQGYSLAFLHVHYIQFPRLPYNIQFTLYTDYSLTVDTFTHLAAAMPRKVINLKLGFSSGLVRDVDLW